MSCSEKFKTEYVEVLCHPFFMRGFGDNDYFALLDEEARDLRHGFIMFLSDPVYPVREKLLRPSKEAHDMICVPYSRMISSCFHLLIEDVCFHLIHCGFIFTCSARSIKRSG